MMKSVSLTEFEEQICFDLDDPDFNFNFNSTSSLKYTMESKGRVEDGRQQSWLNLLDCDNAAFLACAATAPMSMTRVHPPEMHNSLSRRSSSIGSLGSSLEELHHYFNSSDAVLSIEELRLQLNSCFTCGVSWHDEHVSLDCRECGGYSLERPCPLCDGRCNSVWKRDLTMSHATGKARWEGECALRCKPAADSKFGFKSISAEEESRLCSRLEKLGASS